MPWQESSKFEDYWGVTIIVSLFVQQYEMNKEERTSNVRRFYMSLNFRLIMRSYERKRTKSLP